MDANKVEAASRLVKDFEDLTAVMAEIKKASDIEVRIEQAKDMLTNLRKQIDDSRASLANVKNEADIVARESAELKAAAEADCENMLEQARAKAAAMAQEAEASANVTIERANAAGVRIVREAETRVRQIESGQQDKMEALNVTITQKQGQVERLSAQVKEAEAKLEIVRKEIAKTRESLVGL